MNHPRYSLLGYASMALATLTKGPVGLLIPAAILLIFLAAAQKIRRGKEMAWVGGPLLYLLIVTPWFLSLSVDSSLGTIFFQQIFYQESLIRYETLRESARPFYYYLLALSGGMSLWIWMLPAGLLSAFVGAEKEEREKSLFLLI